MAHFKHSNIISDLKKMILLLKKYTFESTNSMEIFRLNNIIGHQNEVFFEYNTEDLVFNVTTSGMDAKPTVKKISITLNTKYTLDNELSNPKDTFKEFSWNFF